MSDSRSRESRCQASGTVRAFRDRHCDAPAGRFRGDSRALERADVEIKHVDWPREVETKMTGPISQIQLRHCQGFGEVPPLVGHSRITDLPTSAALMVYCPL